MKLYISAQDHAMKSKFSTAIYKQNVLISLRFGDPVQCRRGLYIRAWVLYLCFGTGEKVVIKHVGSSDISVQHL